MLLRKIQISLLIRLVQYNISENINWEWSNAQFSEKGNVSLILIPRKITKWKKPECIFSDDDVTYVHCRKSEKYLKV